MKYELPKLSYAYDALEPYIDARTMEIHHTKHHQAYVDKLNEALGKHPEIADKPLLDLLKDLNSVPEDIRTAVRNHGGGHYNHSLFWKMMAPNAGGQPDGQLAEVINSTFGKYENLKEEFSKVALSIFGSGWGWLVVTQSKELKVMTAPNQDSPLMSGNIPILGIDMWEHAFYLLRQNRKAEYVDAWWNVVNWEQVEANLKGGT